MDSGDITDIKENSNTTTTLTRILRRSSILKSSDFDSKLMDEITADETTRIRKSRRVSFSQKILVKTFDELKSKPNDSITEVNTLANANTSIKRSHKKKLNDLTNPRVDDFSIMSLNKTAESNEDTSILPLNTTFETDSMINYLNSTNIKCLKIKMEDKIENLSIRKDNYDEKLEITLEESVLLENQQNETIHQSISDPTDGSIDSPPNLSLAKSIAIPDQSKTYEMVDNTAKTQIMDDATTISQIRVDETQNIQCHPCSSITEPSFINKTCDSEKTLMINKSFDIEHNKESKSFNSSQLSAPKIKSSTKKKKGIDEAINKINEKNRSINISGFNLSSLNETLSNCDDLIETNNRNVENELKLALERSRGVIERMRVLKSKLDDAGAKKKQELENLSKKKFDRNNEIDRIEAENLKMRIDIEKIWLNTSTDPQLTYLLIDNNEENVDKHLNDLKNLTEKNKNNEKEIRDAKRKLDNLKDNVDIGFDQIESLRGNRDEKEKLTRLYRLIFDDKLVDFNVVGFDQDTIQLAFFNDLIQVQIKVTNLVNDLMKKFSWESNESNEFLLDDVNKKFKYLNYPIKQINMQTNVDSHGNKMLTRASRISLSNKYSKKKVPMFVRYCIALIMGEFNLDSDGNLILTEHKFKFVKDLPIFTARLRLACHCATNLAKDLEELLAKYEKCTNTIDFDIKNFFINFCISSIEDPCLYNLRLNVEPGAYYQLPIPFKIDQDGLDEPFEPNYAKLSKLLEEKCFENGSMKSFFKKLNVF